MPILALHNPRIVVIFIVVAGHAVMAYLGSSPVRVAGIAPSHSAVAGDSAVAASEAVAGGVQTSGSSTTLCCSAGSTTGLASTLRLQWQWEGLRRRDGAGGRFGP